MASSSADATARHLNTIRRLAIALLLVDLWPLGLSTWLASHYPEHDMYGPARSIIVLLFIGEFVALVLLGQRKPLAYAVAGIMQAVIVAVGLLTFTWCVGQDAGYPHMYLPWINAIVFGVLLGPVIVLHIILGLVGLRAYRRAFASPCLLQ